MTIGVLEQGGRCVAELVALACEKARIDCLVVRDSAEATRVLRAFRLDALLLDIGRPDEISLAWLETETSSWPGLPSRTLLLTNDTFTEEEKARIRRVGVEIVPRPGSVVAAARFVATFLRQARSGPPSFSEPDVQEEVLARLQALGRGTRLPAFGERSSGIGGGGGNLG